MNSTFLSLLSGFMKGRSDIAQMQREQKRKRQERDEDLEYWKKQQSYIRGLEQKTYPDLPSSAITTMSNFYPNFTKLDKGLQWELWKDYGKQQDISAEKQEVKEAKQKEFDWEKEKYKQEQAAQSRKEQLEYGKNIFSRLEKMEKKTPKVEWKKKIDTDTGDEYEYKYIDGKIVGERRLIKKATKETKKIPFNQLPQDLKLILPYWDHLDPNLQTTLIESYIETKFKQPKTPTPNSNKKQPSSSALPNLKNLQIPKSISNKINRTTMVKPPIVSQKKQPSPAVITTPLQNQGFAKKNKFYLPNVYDFSK